MTTTEHLNKIVAKCEELLAIAAKRTPGEWVFTEDGCANGGLTCDIIDSGDFAASSAEVSKDDAAFVASCSSNADAGWRATIAAIGGFRRQKTRFHLEGFVAGEEAMDNDLEQIIAAWPEEML